MVAFIIVFIMCTQCTICFGISCVCQPHLSPLLPLIHCSKLFVFLPAHESGAAGSKSSQKGYVEQYSLDDGQRKDKKTYFNCKKHVCPTMLFYLNKVTIMAGDHDVDTRNTKVGLYHFVNSKQNLELVVGSKYSTTLIQLKNATCALFNDGIIVVSVLDQITQQSSNRMTFHLFSQDKVAGKNWRMASMLLPPVLHSLDSCKYQIQSCVVISDHLYCSLWLHETIVYIYEINLSPLCKYDKECYDRPLPMRSWLIQELYITGCFLSVFKEEVAITTFKNINNKTVMDVRLFNGADINVTSPIPKPMCQYDFPSVVKVVTVSVVSGADNNTITVIYHDGKANKCCTMRLRM